MNYINTCAAGLEKLVADELMTWNAQSSEVGKGFVKWSGNLEAGYRACLWSRFSSRVILVLDQFAVSSSNELYEGARSIEWEEHFSEHSSFAVDCSISADSPIKNSMFGALRIKDAIVDRFRDRTGVRPTVQLQRPEIQISSHISDNRALIGLDLSGESLHRRGYRVEGGTAPLKESLAAAIIALSGWNGDTLVDPFCGSGTLLIEAALIYGDSAPGLGRSYFGVLGWHAHQEKLWSSLVAEAIERENAAQNKPWPSLIGYDADRSAIRAARKNIAGAGLEEKISVSRQEIHQLDNTYGSGWIVCNPPYGERMSEKQSVKHLYRFLGNHLQQYFAGWKLALFTAVPDYADLLKIKWQASHKLFNGPLSCRLLCGSPVPGLSDSRDTDWQIAPQTGGEQPEEFANRLKKNFKKLISWARKHQLQSLRIYDRDLPQYNVSVDLFGDHVYIKEFQPPAKIDSRVADERFKVVIQSVRSLFNVGRDRVSISRWQRTRPTDTKKTGKEKLYEVGEQHCFFLVSLPGHPDTGFFPDQRFVRKRIAESAGQASFLSIYDTSGAATVQAVRGRARKTVTAGISAKDQLRIAQNFNRNGLAVEQHTLIQEHVLPWLRTHKDRYDLIYINPRRIDYFRGKSTHFNLAADQKALIRLAVNRLNPKGHLLFSTMLPSFTLDPVILERFDCRNISSEMAPADFQKQSRWFQCWEIRSKVEDC